MSQKTATITSSPGRCWSSTEVAGLKTRAEDAARRVVPSSLLSAGAALQMPGAGVRDRAALCTTTDAGQKAAEPRFLNFLSFEGRGRRAAPGQKGKNSNAPDQIRHRAGDHVSTYLRISSRLSKRKKAQILPLGGDGSLPPGRQRLAGHVSQAAGRSRRKNC